MIDFGLDLKRANDGGEWELFERITAAYFGKEYYFLNDITGTVYSRLSHEVLATKDDAYNEFIRKITSY